MPFTVEVLEGHFAVPEIVGLLGVARRTAYQIIERKRERVAREARAHEDRERKEQEALEGVLAQGRESPALRGSVIRRYSS